MQTISLTKQPRPIITLRKQPLPIKGNGGYPAWMGKRAGR